MGQAGILSCLVFLLLLILSFRLIYRANIYNFPDIKLISGNIFHNSHYEQTGKSGACTHRFLRSVANFLWSLKHNNYTNFSFYKNK